MTQRDINRSPELPASFDLRKYDCCANFTAIDWHVNLALRYARTRAERPPLVVLAAEDSSENYAEMHEPSAAKRAEAWLQKPIRVPDMEMMSIMAIMAKQAPDLHRQVVDQRVFHLLESAEFLDPQDEAARVYLDAHSTYRKGKGKQSFRDPSFDAAMKRLAAPAWEMLRDCDPRFRGRVPVFVDLHATDDKLRSDFEAWLRDARAALGIEARARRFDQKTFDRWHEYKILAYLDLTYWAQANDTVITHQVLGNALFPDDIDTGLNDRIRKVVMRHADSAMSLAAIDALHRQWEAELEQK